KQAGELIHMSGTDFYYESLVTLAERLSKIAPMPGPHRFYYGNSGAEAIESALKMARYHTGRQQIIAFYGAFHGRTMGALSLTASKPQQRRRFAPLVPGVTHVPFPDVYRKGEQDALACARFIEDKLFKTTVPPEEVAAIFIEPVQGEGGWVPASHASTFGGNPVCIAAALATLEVIERDGLLRNTEEVGKHMISRMSDWSKKHRLVGDVRGRGLMIGVELVLDKQTKQQASA